MTHALEDLFRPTVLLFLILGVAIANLWRKRREERRRLLWVTVPYVLLFLMFLPVVDYLVVLPLERSYPTAPELAERPEVLVVLSGYLFAPDDGNPARVEMGWDTLTRCQHALVLYRKYPGCTILATGGMSPGAPKGPTLAEAMRDFFVRYGVRESDLLVENQSLSTRENAADSARLLRERGLRRIVLITDAKHMWRAVRCFEREGFEVVPSACNSYSGRFRLAWQSFLPSPRGAVQLLEGVHEWVGLAYYKLRGWI